MSGPDDPISQEAIDKVVAGAPAASTTDDRAGFVEGAEADPAVVTDPAQPKVETELPANSPGETADSKLARLEHFMREEMFDGAARLDQGRDLVDLVIEITRNAVVIPGRLGGSVLPSVCEDVNGGIESITVVGQMSGGADEIEGMPRMLELVRRVRGGQEMHARYVKN